MSEIPGPDNASLSVSDLTVGFDIDGKFLPAVISVSFDVARGETLCLVGESGSGKSVTAFAIMRLVRMPGRIAHGRILFEGRDLLTLSEREMQKIRGAGIALIFQEPMTAMNPVFTVGDQIEETLRVHGRATRRTARAKAIELLEAVSIPEPHRRAREYPHQLSGGLRQRALIAMALSCEPAVVIADEPTTALDVTIQAQILELLRDLQKRMGLALVLITHDLGVVAKMADRVAVMYAGRIVEDAPLDALFSDPKHPYTRALMAAIPGGAPGSRLVAIRGNVPPLGELPPGCCFEPRCPNRFEPCPLAQPGDTASLPPEGGSHVDDLEGSARGLPDESARGLPDESARGLLDESARGLLDESARGFRLQAEVADTVMCAEDSALGARETAGRALELRPPGADGPAPSPGPRKPSSEPRHAHTVKCYLYGPAVEGRG